MSVTWSEIQGELERLLACIREDAGARLEFDTARAEFHQVTATAAGTLRYLEWFLLERPSAALGGVPARLWCRDARLSPSLSQSIPGAFEVLSPDTDEGVELRDLFSGASVSVCASHLASPLEVGDLVIGRLYPVESGSYLIPPSAVRLRSPELLHAVRTDLEQMRTARRGVLRVQQLELERLFFSMLHETEAQQPSLREAMKRCEALLRQLGLGSEAKEIVERTVQSAPEGHGSVITEILDDLAFETSVDLDRARLGLLELWQVAASTRSGALDSGLDAREALASFDRGRSEGQDLEQLFRQLERDLGLEEAESRDENGESDEAGVPDFPGVIGAMVEEFFWDVEREQGPMAAALFEPLRSLGDFARNIGVFEDFKAAHVLEYSARWSLDLGKLRDPKKALALLRALEAFCAWCEERHQMPLRSALTEVFPRLHESLPRHVRLRETFSGRVGAHGGTIVHVHESRARVRAPDGRAILVPVSPAQAELLRPGDCVVLGELNGEFEVTSAYPPEILELSVDTT
jgi:hypothetical protein